MMKALSNKEKQRLRQNYGPWALVTGATSGIGEEIAHQLAAAGLNVLLHGRRADKLSEMAASLSTTHGIEAKTVAADLATPEGVAAVIDATNPISIGLLVASAGFGTSGSFLHTSLHQEVGMVRVNCEALMAMAHHFARLFAQQKRGGIILLSSIVAFQGVPFAANYAATKAYVQSLAEALAIELKPEGVDVLAAAPGPVASGFGARANMRMGKALTPKQVAQPILKALGRQTTTLPGALTKFLVYSLRTVPRWGKVRIMKTVMGGMTKHQRA